MLNNHSRQDLNLLLLHFLDCQSVKTHFYSRTQVMSPMNCSQLMNQCMLLITNSRFMEVFHTSQVQNLTTARQSHGLTLHTHGSAFLIWMKESRRFTFLNQVLLNSLCLQLQLTESPIELKRFRKTSLQFLALCLFHCCICLALTSASGLMLIQI